MFAGFKSKMSLHRVAGSLLRAPSPFPVQVKALVHSSELSAVSYHPKKLKSFTDRPFPAELRVRNLPIADKTELQRGSCLAYLGNANRDKRYPDNMYPGMYGDTNRRFFSNVFRWNYELYPLFGVMLYWLVLTAITCLWTFTKMDIHLDRRHRLPPSDWERCNADYWKHNAILFQMKDSVNVRMPDYAEQIQDELLIAAKRTGRR